MKKIVLFLVLTTCLLAKVNAQNTTPSQDEIEEAQRDSITKKMLSNAGATSTQVTQFMQAKESYGDQIKAVRKSTSLTEEQKKQQIKQLTDQKNAQYVQILGKVIYRQYNKLKNASPED